MIKSFYASAEREISPSRLGWDCTDFRWLVQDHNTEELGKLWRNVLRLGSFSHKPLITSQWMLPIGQLTLWLLVGITSARFPSVLHCNFPSKSNRELCSNGLINKQSINLDFPTTSFLCFTVWSRFGFFSCPVSVTSINRANAFAIEMEIYRQIVIQKIWFLNVTNLFIFA